MKFRVFDQYDREFGWFRSREEAVGFCKGLLVDDQFYSINDCKIKEVKDES